MLALGVALLAMPPAFADQAHRDAILAELSVRAPPIRNAGAIPAWLAQVYAVPDPVWFVPSSGARPEVDVALRELDAADRRGLDRHGAALAALERELSPATTPGASPQAIAKADVALTAAVLQMMSDLRFGRVRPQDVEPHYRAPTPDAAFVAGLREAVASRTLAAAIDAAEPRFALYARLKLLLARYRALDAESAWPPLDLPREKVDPGDAYPSAGMLADRLVRLGDLAPGIVAAGETRYVAALSDAVRRFQQRHGLAADGVLGKATIAALNTPPSARVHQIALSMERMRWLPDIRAGPLVAINIPSFRLWALDDAARPPSAALTMPVIVGRAMRSETPVFLGEMRSVEFSPYWNVPPSILRNEYLGRLARDPALLSREDMEIVPVRAAGVPSTAIDDATLNGLASGSLRMRQRPGPKNALGGVK